MFVPARTFFRKNPKNSQIHPHLPPFKCHNPRFSTFITSPCTIFLTTAPPRSLVRQFGCIRIRRLFENSRQRRHVRRENHHQNPREARGNVHNDPPTPARPWKRQKSPETPPQRPKILTQTPPGQRQVLVNLRARVGLEKISSDFDIAGVESLAPAEGKVLGMILFVVLVVTIVLRRFLRFSRGRTGPNWGALPGRSRGRSCPRMFR